MASIELLGPWSCGGEPYVGYWPSTKKVLNKTTGLTLTYIGVETGFYNGSEKEIKYVTFKYVPRNAVSDIITDNLGVSVTSQRFTGPIAPDTFGKAEFETVWQIEEIDHIEIQEITVDYMDNTSEIISGKDLTFIFNSPIEYSDFFPYKLNKAKISNESFVSRLYSSYLFKKALYGEADTSLIPSTETCFNTDSAFYKKRGEAIKAADAEYLAEKAEKAAEEEEEKKRRAIRDRKKELAGKIGCFAATLIPIAIIVLIVCFASSLG